MPVLTARTLVDQLTASEQDRGEGVFDTLLFGFQSVAWATAGVLVVSRQPRNPIGWVFCGSAVFSAFANLAE